MQTSGLNSDLNQRRNLPPLNINNLTQKYPLRHTIEQLDESLLRSIDVSRMQYLNNAPAANRADVKAKISSSSVECLVYGVGVGGVLGSLVGGVAGGLTIGPLGAGLGAAIGIPIGSALGCSVGAAVGATIEIVNITVDPVYLRWKAHVIDREKYETYKQHLRAELPEVEEFFCPILGDFPVIPVRNRSNHVYDLDSISAHLDRKDRERAELIRGLQTRRADAYETSRAISQFNSNVCPFRGACFNKSQLVYDAQYCLHIRQVLSNILDRRSDISDDVREGLTAFVTSLRNNHTLIMAQKVQRACARMDELGVNNPQTRIDVINQILQEGQ